MPVGLPAVGPARVRPARQGGAGPGPLPGLPRPAARRALGRVYDEAGGLHRELAGGLGCRCRPGTWSRRSARSTRWPTTRGSSRCTPSSASPSWPAPGRWCRSARRTAVPSGWRSGPMAARRLDGVPTGDDALDALAAAWSAQRYLRGRRPSLPEHPGDERGRQMRIVTLPGLLKAVIRPSSPSSCRPRLDAVLRHMRAGRVGVPTTGRADGRRAAAAAPRRPARPPPTSNGPRPSSPVAR